MQEQNFKNHTQIVYKYYLFTGLPILILIGIAITKIVHHFTNDLGWILLLIGWILLSMLFRSRGFALKAQDRAIRAEEQFRFYRLTGKSLPSNLGIGQIIALRFASDEEMPAMAEKAAREKLANKEIKQQIRNWRTDDYRV